MIFKDLTVPERIQFNSVSISSELVGYLGYTKINKTGFLF